MDEILRGDNITKHFPGVLAVDNVSFSLGKGETLALLGENGAGKSTLMKIISGVLKPDKGELILNGEKVVFNSSSDAINAGIGTVYQELSLVGGLSIAENIFANRQPVNKFNKILWSDLYKKTSELLRKFNLNYNPRELVKYLSMGQQQLIEILKATSLNPKVLILDEPTTSLTDAEIRLLFANMNELKKNGMSFIYISHKLSEIFQIADRVAVLRDGKYIGTKQVKEVNENELISMMVGRNITDLFGSDSDTRQTYDTPFFEVRNFTKGSTYIDINFNLKKKEILGFFGLIGAGRSELALSIFGSDNAKTGTVIMNDRELKIKSPRDAIAHKIVYLTEDRKKLGLYLRNSLKNNVIAPSLDQFTKRFGIVDEKKIIRNAKEQVELFSIATPSVNQKVLNLSGGNQQKALISMWMGVNPEVVIFDEPTKGVDVGARKEIYEKIRQYATNGCGVIIISSDLPELIGLCDRVLVMNNGKIVGEVLKPDFSEELLLSYAAGVV
ncbi:MAG TPA: sugar ABC transporter ATP-binding protein [Syntrophomonas sp.]|nr:sugar ABC transporter ATP-binding protein [Syntrophomonas sp.]